ncbi:MAG: disulfide bond formation protein B [Cobetia crustatorum]
MAQTEHDSGQQAAGSKGGLAHWNGRQWCLLGALGCALLLGVAFVLQFAFGMAPCSLGIFQRVAVAVAGAFFLLGALHGPGRIGTRIYALGALAGTIGAIVLAGRHVWLQSLPPDQVPSCGPGLNYMLEVLPVWDVITQVLNASGECAQISGQLLGLSIPEWSLMGFCGLALVPLAMLWSSFRR